MTGRAPTYQEVLAASRLAAEEIRDWPAWKRALVEAERPRSQQVETERREDPKPR